jgi:hypothetical protein
VAGVGAAVCVAVTGGVTISNAGAEQTTTPVCSSNQLRPAFGRGQGAAGTLQDTWRVTNEGTHTCRMSGYARVQNYRPDGRTLPTHVSHMGTPHNVVLTPGQHASFDLRYPNPGAINCTGEHPARMTIQTPGARAPVIVSGGLPSCNGKASESPLRHGN